MLEPNPSGGIPQLPEVLKREKVGNERKHIIIVGFGMVALSFLEKMLESDKIADQYTLQIIGEENYLAYNRVGLTEYFVHRNSEKLLLSPKEFFETRDPKKWNYTIDEKVTLIDQDSKSVTTTKGNTYSYDILVLSTGSNAFIPYDVITSKLPKSDSIEKFRENGIFVYRTIEDLNSMLHHAEVLLKEKDFKKEGKMKRAIVVGGGLLGLEAAQALKEMEEFENITVVQRTAWLLPQQLDEKGGKLLCESVKSMGITVKCSTTIEELFFDENDGNKITKVRYNNGDVEDCQLLCYAIGIRPRDELAGTCSLIRSPRGGFTVDDHLQTNDPSIYAIGECASWNNKTFGLIAPGMTMADNLSFNLTQAKNHSPKLFSDPDVGTRLKLMGVDVASFGDYFADISEPKWLPKEKKATNNEGPKTRSLIFEDPIEGKYIKLILTKDGKYLLGGILVGDASNYTKFSALAKSRKPLPLSPSELIINKPGEDGDDIDLLPDDTQICSCKNVLKGQITEKIRDGTCKTLADIKKCTKAGTACGGCEPTLKVILQSELKKMGQTVSNDLCIHFKHSRADLFSLIMVKQIKSFKEVMKQLSTDPEAAGCEICKPTVGSILSTLNNRHILESDVNGLQETNDKYLGNIQRNGTYSVVPRMSAGEVTPEKLIAIGQIAKKYDVYTKITGAQRVDLFGVKKQDLPEVWKELYEVGFESGQAYGKTLRNVKSCVGSTWCRYGIGDSVGLAIRLEERYKGIRSPHKMKGGVSGCVRDCAEFHSKDFGLCAVQNGFNVYVGGNGGMKPAHALLLQADVAPDQVIPLLDRYLMFYFRTADRLQRTARWLENLAGGIEYLKDVVVRDKLGICKELETQMQQLVGGYYDEWEKAVKENFDDSSFKQFVNTDETQDTVEIIRERGQRRPADWPNNDVAANKEFNRIVWSSTSWTKVCESSKLPVEDAGSSATVLVSNTQIAIFRLRDKLYACQNMCGHKRAFVLGQGILSTDENGEAYVSCPLHKRNYILEKESEHSGDCKNDATMSVATFEIKEEDGDIYVKLPPVLELDDVLGTSKWMVKKEETKEKPFTKVDKRFKFKLPVRKFPAVAAGCSSIDDLNW